jgi:tetratricopeptide (TPR) repeat protein
MRKLLFVAVLVLFPAALLLADVVHMTDGRKIKGKIVSETEDYVLLKGKYGEVKLNKHEIDHIDYGSVEEKEEQSKPSKPKVKKKPKPRKTKKVDLASLVDKAAKGDAQAAKKLIAAKRAALVPINKKLKDAEGEEKTRLEKLRDEIEKKTQAEKAEGEKHYQEAARILREREELKKKIGSKPSRAQVEKLTEMKGKAAEEIEKAYELDPTEPKITPFIIAVLYYEAKRYSRAIPILESELVHKPDDKDVLQMLASSYMNLNKFKKARKMLEKILKKEPDNKTAWAIFGELEQKEKKFDKAIKNYEKAISLGMDTWGTRFNLGICYKNKKKWQKAIENFEKCRKHNPKDGNALIELGSLYSRIGEYEKAVEALETFCELYPNTSLAKDFKKQIPKLKKLAEKQKK